MVGEGASVRVGEDIPRERRRMKEGQPSLRAGREKAVGELLLSCLAVEEMKPQLKTKKEEDSTQRKGGAEICTENGQRMHGASSSRRGA